MRMSDEEYFRSCVARERQLAHLLGHKVEEFYEDAGTLWDGAVAMPRWTRDWAACGPLIAEHEIAVRFDRDAAEGHAHCIHAGAVSVKVSGMGRCPVGGGDSARVHRAVGSRNVRVERSSWRRPAWAGRPARSAPPALPWRARSGRPPAARQGVS